MAKTIIETWWERGPSCFPTEAEYTDEGGRHIVERVTTEDGLTGLVDYRADAPSDTAYELSADDIEYLGINP